MAGLSRAYKRRGNMVSNTGAPVMCLDAGSRLSYPGSGTTWTDLSGNGNNGTLTNGPTYDAANAGSIVFDGVNDLVPTTLQTRGYAGLSVVAWVKTVATGDRSIAVAYGTSTGIFGTFINGGEFNIYSTPGVGRNATNTAIYRTGAWVHFCAFYDGGSATMGHFANGAVLAGTTTGTVPANLPANTFPVVIGAAGNLNLYYFNGNLGQVTLYNRALSAAEVKTNFDLTRGRYGI